eukprot:TRINITY_DN95387_c0_g1_i1.p1 TRINITY_DN95387_c0_g1~~TRINITY_DN95387_c0_g1_i1.p1  ORF type:complete len:418 (-),score=80.26 TRINITY_DN95387_c0_g1_i1:138-1391(-)
MKLAAAAAFFIAATAVASGAKVRPRSKESSEVSFIQRSERNAKSRSLSISTTPLPSWYHTSENIFVELGQLSEKCPELTWRTVKKTGGASNRTASVEVYNVKAKDAKPKNRNFLLFGEHARELISPESALHFIKLLCSSNDRAKKILQHSEFEIVANGNPDSRQLVEQGNYCLRTDPDQVDLNRNWDAHWVKLGHQAQTSPGPHAFSEPEVMIFKELVTQYKPTTFLTIHSGTLGMYMPYAYDKTHIAERNKPAMMQVLQELDSTHCQCPFGAAGHEINYNSPGTCLDWVYDDLQVPFAFAWEIYVGGLSAESKTSKVALLKKKWQEHVNTTKGSFLQMNSHLGHEYFKDIFSEFPSSFVQLSMENQMRSEMEQLGVSSVYDCFTMFNPEEEDDFKKTLENWSQAYLEMAEKVSARL